MMSVYMDMTPLRDECAALLALLLSVSSLTGTPTEETEGWVFWAVAVPLGFVVCYLLFLGGIYFVLQREFGDDLMHSYTGRGGHAASSGAVGALVIGSSVSDRHVPGGTHAWIPGCTVLGEDAGYGVVLFG